MTFCFPLSEATRADSLLFRLDGLELHLIPGSSFEDVADAVGTLRESTYRQQLSGSGMRLDGRDAAYEHLILLEPTAVLAGSNGCNSFLSSGLLRSSPTASSRIWSTSTPASKPCWRRNLHVEIGRVALPHAFSVNRTP